MLDYTLKSQSEYLQLLPDQLFAGSEEMNRNFLKNALQTALNQKKNDMVYFEPLKCEESLFIFFQSKSSPILSKINELDSIRNFTKPIIRKSVIDSANDNSELNDFVFNWIRESSLILLNFEEKNQKEVSSDDEKQMKLDVIEIFVVRFVFDITFPYLDWNPLPDLSFSSQIEKLSKKTARNLQISLDFLRPELHDAVCTKIFEVDSISRAPIEWIISAQYEICPIRAAYCLSKAHEALTIMATIAAADNEIALKNINSSSSENLNQNQDSIQNLNQNKNLIQNDSIQNLNENLDISHSETRDERCKTKTGNASNDLDAKTFFSKVPGFDDIFGFWVCLLCSAKLADPRGLNQFITEWGNLPGFSNRTRAACTYFEAAIVHIESGEACEKDK